MSFEKGQSGNPTGVRKRNLLSSALDKALLADDQKKVRQIAEKIAELAADGDRWAVEFVWDRVEGKVATPVDILHRHEDVPATARRIEEILGAGAEGHTQKPLLN